MAGSERGVMSPCGRYVLLAGGLALPIEPLELALELESRGFSFGQDGEGMLVVRAHECLTDDDRRRIRRWKWHLLALVDYQAPGSLQGREVLRWEGTMIALT